MVSLSLLAVAPKSFGWADDQRSEITSQDKAQARDLLENAHEHLSGRESRLLREIRSDLKESLTDDERKDFDRIKRRLPNASEWGD
jgi:hypothetical protein